MKTLNKFLIIILIIFGTSTIKAQEAKYKISGNEIVKIEAEKKVEEAVKTKLTHTIKEVKYPVYQSPKGAYYILRKSKKTGKEYKQYLKIE